MIDRDDLSDLHGAAVAVQDALSVLVERLEVLLPEPEPESEPDAERFMAERPARKVVVDDGRMTTSVRLRLEVMEGLKILAIRQRVRVNDILAAAAESYLAANGMPVKPKAEAA